jgi:hypothetical protein
MGDGRRYKNKNGLLSQPASFVLTIKFRSTAAPARAVNLQTGEGTMYHIVPLLWATGGKTPNARAVKAPYAVMRGEPS